MTRPIRGVIARSGRPPRVCKSGRPRHPIIPSISGGTMSAVMDECVRITLNIDADFISEHLMPSLTRREVLTAGTAAAAAATLVRPMSAEPAKKEPFAYCLNTSTVRGQSLPIAQVVDVAARAGYTAIEPWIDELDKPVQSGG